MAAEREVGLDPLLERDQAKLLETGNLGLREWLAREVLQGRSPPERERCPQELLRTLGVACGQRLSPLGGHPLEADQVKLLGVDREQVAAFARAQALGSERLAEMGDVYVETVQGALRWALAPERIDQAIRRDSLAEVEEKESE
jgi:hypothetical protein